ncbi:MAG: DNA-processing protein DprA [Clostridia bacterium]|nr:DNA-processing protein DprA [Clostridia bacterium]MDD4386615.1 DNA-processing protein DprA [Clostridia bacterium]
MEYLWLSIYVKLDYLTYINLLRVFKDVKEIYYISKDKDKILKIIKSNSIYVSYSIFSNLVNSQLKVKSIELFQSLCENSIKIINIHSKEYPQQLINVFNPPLVIFARGNLSLLKNKKVYIYSSNNFSITGKRKYYEFYKYMNNNNISIVSDEITEYSNIVYLPYIKEVEREDILIVSDKLEKNKFINYEYITGISDCLFIPETNYNIKAAIIVDLILEQGKDILVIPGSIYNKDSYFSNYLIKDGAICITSKTDLLEFFT